MYKNIVFVMVFLSFFAGIPLYSIPEEPIGKIVRIEGMADIHRNGEVWELFDTDVGIEVYNQDLVETSDGGNMEIELIAYTTPGTIVKITENTAFYLDFSRPTGSAHINFALLVGSLAFKVPYLLDTEELNVLTQSAAMGVRGTEFEIVTTPEGSILVVCTEGKVICEDNQFNQQFAQTGRVVEKRTSGPLRRINLAPGEEGLYKKFWINQREQVFKAGAPAFVKAYAQQYLNNLPTFAEAYRKVTSHREALLRYGDGSAEELNSDLLLIYNEMSKDLIPAQGMVNLFERIYYRIKLLESYHVRGIGRTRLTQQMDSREFFTNFTAYEPVLKSQMAEMHYLYKLFSNLASSSGGLGGMGDIFTTNSLEGGMLEGF